jgi:hypothetical protein
MAHGDAREGEWRGNWRMEWVTSTLHTTSEHGVSSITTADARTSAASIRLNWGPRRFKWTRPFRRKTKSCFCACTITFKLASIENFRDYILGVETRLRAAPSRVRIAPVKNVLFSKLSIPGLGHTQPPVQWYRVSFRERSVLLTAHVYLVPKLRMSGAIPLLSLCTFVEWAGINLIS